MKHSIDFRDPSKIPGVKIVRHRISKPGLSKAFSCSTITEFDFSECAPEVQDAVKERESRCDLTIEKDGQKLNREAFEKFYDENYIDAPFEP